MGISHSLGSCSFPQSLRSSGEFLKTIHRMVFLTEFHPNGFDPRNSMRTKKQACFHTCSFSMVEMMGISHSLGSCSFPQSLRSSGEFLKTIHRMVFLTEFHPNGFDPRNSMRTKKQACFHTCSFSMVEMMGISHSLGSCSFPQSLRSSGEFLKTIHRMVFLTEFHPNGFDPRNSMRTKKQACFHTCSFSMVEMMGIEPTASALRTLRSPN